MSDASSYVSAGTIKSGAHTDKAWLISEHTSSTFSWFASVFTHLQFPLSEQSGATLVTQQIKLALVYNGPSLFTSVLWFIHFHLSPTGHYRLTNISHDSRSSEMAFNFMLPLRIAQFILAILVLALEAYGMPRLSSFAKGSSTDNNFSFVSGIMVESIYYLWFPVPRQLPDLHCNLDSPPRYPIPHTLAALLP